jgi:predicted hydrocarbon binding protein
MHGAVRRRSSNAAPPKLGVARVRPNEVLLVYTSHRRLCDFGRGMILGLAAHFSETVELSEEACMHEGASACRIRVVGQKG